MTIAFGGGVSRDGEMGDRDLGHGTDKILYGMVMGVGRYGYYTVAFWDRVLDRKNRLLRIAPRSHQTHTIGLTSVGKHAAERLSSESHILPG